MPLKAGTPRGSEALAVSASASGIQTLKVDLAALSGSQERQLETGLREVFADRLEDPRTILELTIALGLPTGSAQNDKAQDDKAQNPQAHQAE